MGIRAGDIDIMGSNSRPLVVGLEVLCACSPFLIRWVGYDVVAALSVRLGVRQGEVRGQGVLKLMRIVLDRDTRAGALERAGGVANVGDLWPVAGRDGEALSAGHCR